MISPSGYIAAALRSGPSSRLSSAALPEARETPARSHGNREEMNASP